MAYDKRKQAAAAELESLGPLPGGRHGLSRHHVAKSQRARLLRAVVDAVGEKGYATTTIADVAARADVSKKTFYIHFDDKESCFLAAYDAFARYIREHMEQSYRGAEGGWRERYAASVATYLELIAVRPERSRALLQEVLAAGPNVLARRRRVLKDFEGMLIGIHRAARRGDASIPAIPAPLFALKVGGIDELVRSYLVEGRATQLPALTATIAANFAWLLGDRSALSA